MADMEDLRQQVYDAISRARHLDTYEVTHRENVDLTDAVVGVFADVVAERDMLREGLEPLVPPVWTAGAPFVEVPMDREDWDRARAALDTEEPR